MADVHPVVETKQAEGGQAVFIIQQGAEQPKYIKKQALFGLGLCNVLIGIICLICNIVTLAAQGFGGNYPGIWMAIFLCISGGLGMAIKSNPNNNGIRVGCLIMSILATIICFVSLIVSGLSVTVAGILNFVDSVWFLSYIMFVVITILSAVAFITTIIQASFCCNCCYSTEAPSE